MSNEVTKAFAAQDALFDLIDDLAGLSAWTRELGMPSRFDELHLWVDDAIDEWSREDVASNLTTQQETFVLHVYLYSRRLDATFKEQRDEVASASALIEDALHDSPTLTDVVMQARVVGGEFQGAWADSEGRERAGILRLDVRCVAWLA